MTASHHSTVIPGGHGIIVMILCLFYLFMPAALQAQRHDDERIYLEHADNLSYDEYARRGVQIVKGNVRFRHAGTRLSCDSAYFNQEANSFEAFGHVRMLQGDTLELVSDYALYDGRPDVEMVYARKNVKVTHHKTSVLTTDSLNLDRKFNFVYYAEGGTFVDKAKGVRLNSDWGRYDMNTKEARFFYDVTLKTKTHVITTDTLYYDSRIERAQVVGMIEDENGSKKPSVIHSIADGYDVTTTNCYYYLNTDRAELFDHSTIADATRTITGDSLYYDSGSSQSKGRGRVFYDDKKNKNRLTADECEYNDGLGVGLATRNPVFVDYSQADTLYLHADTIRLKTFYINTDSMYREVYCYNKVRVYRNDVQAVCDSLVLCSRDSSMTMHVGPVVWNMGRQLSGKTITVYMNDSTIREAVVEGDALSAELMSDGEHYNQIASKLMNAYFTDGVLRKCEARGNVQTIYYPMDDKDSTLIGLNYLETDTLRMYLDEQRTLEKIWASKSDVVLYPMTQIPPSSEYLPSFGWFDFLRPRNKDDIYFIPGVHDQPRTTAASTSRAGSLLSASGSKGGGR